MIPELDIEKMTLAAASYPRDELHEAVVLALDQFVQIEIAFYVHASFRCKVLYQLPKVCTNIHCIHFFLPTASKKGDLKRHLTAHCKVLA